jgi:hypothetical protein
MDSNEHIRKKIKITNRRLQLLELRQAYKGIDTEPEVNMEIEDLREQLDYLIRQSNMVTEFTKWIGHLRDEQKKQVKSRQIFQEMTTQYETQLKDFMLHIGLLPK